VTFPAGWIDQGRLFTRPWIPPEFPVNFEALTTFLDTVP